MLKIFLFTFLSFLLLITTSLAQTPQIPKEKALELAKKSFDEELKNQEDTTIQYSQTFLTYTFYEKDTLLSELVKDDSDLIEMASKALEESTSNYYSIFFLRKTLPKEDLMTRWAAVGVCVVKDDSTSALEEKVTPVISPEPMEIDTEFFSLDAVKRDFEKDTTRTLVQAKLVSSFPSMLLGSLYGQWVITDQKGNLWHYILNSVNQQKVFLSDGEFKESVANAFEGMKLMLKGKKLMEKATVKPSPDTTKKETK